MTEIFSDGFESGDFSAWTGTATNTQTSITVTNNNPSTGTYNEQASCTTSASNADKAVAYYNVADAYNNLFVQAKNCRFSANPASNTGIPLLGISTNGFGRIASGGVFNDAGTLKWGIRRRSGGAYANVFGSLTPVLNTNYTLELEILKSTVGNSDGESRLWVNGSLEVEATGLDNDDYAYHYILVGIASLWNAQTVAVDVTADDCIIADAYIGSEAAGGLSIPVAMHHYNRINRIIRG